jgi:hypothetical protein
MQGAQARGGELTKVREDLVGELRALRVGRPATTAPTTTAIAHLERGVSRRGVIRTHQAAAPSSLPAGEHRVLTAIAQHGDAGVTREQLSVLTGYRRESRRTYLQKLRSAGLIDVRGDQVIATPAGVAALGEAFEPLPTGDALRDYWLGRLSGGELKIFQALCEAYPDGLELEDISSRTGYARESRRTYLQKLGARRLVVRDGTRARATDEVFG